MSVAQSGLKPIALEYLYEGMEVAEDIYNHDGSLLLLAKGQVLNENSIYQVRVSNENQRNIFVFQTMHQSLLARGFSEKNELSQTYLEERIGYTRLLDKTDDLLRKIEAEGAVSKDMTDAITDEVLLCLTTVPPSLIFQCINAPNPVDQYLRRHSVSVGLLNGLMGKWMHLNREEISQLVIAGFVHDVGKTKTPSQILDAPRLLTISEFEVMKMHPVYSFELLGTDPRFSEPIRLAALQHHEKMNGSGYPDHLSADQISLFARVTAVSDHYDAMVSQRSYQQAQNPFSILARLKYQQFSELDLTLVRVFTENMPNELLGKPTLLSDGSIGIIRFIPDGDMEYPMIEINGEIRKTNREIFCERVLFEPPNMPRQAEANLLEASIRAES